MANFLAGSLWIPESGVIIGWTLVSMEAAGLDIVGLDVIISVSRFYRSVALDWIRLDKLGRRFGHAETSQYATCW